MTTPVPIPPSHRDLIEGAYTAALTTLMPDGQPQTTPVWYNHEGDYLLINTMRGFRKELNMRANPRVTLLIYNPVAVLHNLEIRGVVVEMTEDGAREHLDTLTRRYMNRPDAHFFGDCVPRENITKHFPVKIRIAPLYVRGEG